MEGEVVLNVAEKPSVAQDIVRHLSPRNHTKSNPASRINAVFEFPYTLHNTDITMRVTSVRGHIFSLDFPAPYQDDWTIPPDSLFSAPLERRISDENRDIEENLKICSQGITTLALWLDCDREGEAIAYEVISIVTKYRPNVHIKRAHFSALTRRDILHALENLRNPQKELNDAVEARQEVDLRIGASFTRLLTIKLKQRLLGAASTKKVISYGPCQFPTLGFVIKRYMERVNFQSSEYWYLLLHYEDNANKADFTWKRNRLYDQETVLTLYEDCIEIGKAKVLTVERKEGKKLRPIPLSTVELIKLASKRLKFTSDHTMKLANKLYHSGYISYPRTETDYFQSSINLKDLIKEQVASQNWGRYATKLVEEEGFVWPRKGGHDDNSHPPIHPVKRAERGELDGEEWRVYELITRHFLACCSKDAIGDETDITVCMGFESFHAHALSIRESNFLEIYPYTTWGESTLPPFQPGQVFIPYSLLMKQGNTVPPQLLTESQLITMMEQAGIGTDATIPQHIKTIQDREYATLTEDNRFSPTPVGLALYKAFKDIGLNVTEPELRANMERGLKSIADGGKQKSEVVNSCLEEMYNCYMYTESNIDHMSAVCRQVMEQEKTCPLCKETGHSAAECTLTRGNAQGKRNGNMVCYRCKQTGHFATSCPEASSTKGSTCYACKQPGHYANTCPQRQSATTSDSNCYICQKPGHFANTCPQSKPNGKENRGKSRKRSKKPGKRQKST